VPIVCAPATLGIHNTAEDKAKTAERLGAIGRSEGIAAEAIALLE